MRSILHMLIGIMPIALGASGFSQVLSPGQVHSVSPSLWVLKGDGEVFILPTPTLSPTTTPSPTPTPTPLVIRLPGGRKMEMVRIPAGSYIMGSPEDEQDRWDDESPKHQVTISRDFYLGKYELTKTQWTAVMKTAPWSGEKFVLGDPNSPAVYMSWSGVQDFLAALNRLGQGKFRLPSEAEWEYACRAGTQTRFYWGDDPDYTQVGNYAWYWGNCQSEQYAHIVGLKLPNAWGLYDMCGNAWEMCQDYLHESYMNAPVDGSAWEFPQSSSRVFRGGAWFNSARFCRSAHRSWFSPGSRYYDVYGVRVVRNL